MGLGKADAIRRSLGLAAEAEGKGFEIRLQSGAGRGSFALVGIRCFIRPILSGIEYQSLYENHWC